MTAQPENCLRFQLRYARLMKIDYLCDLPQGQLFVIVETQNRTLDGWDPIDALRQQPLQLGLFQKGRGETFVIIRNIVKQVFALVVSGVLEAGDVQPADFHQPLMILLNGNAQLSGSLLLGWRTLQSLFHGGYGRFDLLRFAPLLAGRPVQTSQAVQDGPTDLVFRVSLEFYVVARVEVIDRRNQTKDAGRHQVFQTDVFRQTLLDTPGNQPHLREMFQDEPFALVVSDHFGHRIRIHMIPPSSHPSRLPSGPDCCSPSGPVPPAGRGWQSPDPPGCAARW